MKDILRWGFLGTARISRALIPPLRASKRNQLAAVASRSLEKAQEFSREWKVPIAYGSYEALLVDPDIDVIYISLPNHLHTEWVVKAAAAGKHVLCEKPLALSTAEVDSIIQAARTYQVHIAEAFMYRHHPQTLKVKELIDSGKIGELRYIQGSFSFPLNRPDDYRWKPAEGGGSLWDIGCYPLSYSLLATNDIPVEVFGWQQKADSGVDLDFIGQLRFASGVFVQIHSSFALPNFTSMELRGSQGTLLIPAPFNPTDRSQFVLHNEKDQIFHVKGGELYCGEVENMSEVILDHLDPRLPLENSWQIIRCLEALYQSAETGKPVQV
ncbi:MAG TPA: Gfo/Idh/MocA family oxidoreductase [Longilinea sp.]|nr:Gfo/Idh/MocA family oxidoreductase [Longilinea sp.]